MTEPTANAPEATLAPAASSAFALTALVQAGFRQVRALVRALKHRRDVTRLAYLDERMLKDMGLTRIDVGNALARPLAVDPSLVLSVRRVEERARARALAIVAAAKSRGEEADQEVCRCG